MLVRILLTRLNASYLHYIGLMGSFVVILFVDCSLAVLLYLRT